ncbi:MAG: alcohol dehydrogenase catalytic domain-containing protein, partial [Actinomycetota bacterium]
MRSVLIRGGAIVVEDQPVPQPGPGQVLVRSRACGICGSDLHMVRHHDEMFEMRKRTGRVGADETEAPPIFLGHELAGEVAALGPGADRHAVGTRVASVPFVMGPDGEMVGVGTTESVYGAFSEYFVLNEATLIPVPDAVPDEAVALAEPLAVGVHAVARGEVGADDAVLVVGAGPVGLAVIAALRMRGVVTIVASDPVAGRRDMALAMGASEVTDPAGAVEMERIAELAGDSRVVIIECAGVTPLIASIIERAPAKACVVFAGVHTA